MKRVTIRDVAKRAAVSTATVSNSLNEGVGVGIAVRKRVIKAAAELGYQPNRAAQSIRTGMTRTLAFVTPDLCNPFYPRLAQAITNAAREAGYSVLLVDTQDGSVEREGLEHIIRYGVDGLIWCPATENDVIARNPIKAPVVAIDQWLPGRDNISPNYRMGGKLIADHVVACGYRTVGMISGPKDISAARLRREHFLEHLDGRAEVVWEIFHPFDMTPTAEARVAIARRDVEVIVCCDDLMGVGAMHAAQDIGLSVPDDVAIIGHDDISVGTVVRPGLTTVRQPLIAMGREAVRMIIERLDAPDMPRRDLSIDVELVLRGSTSLKDSLIPKAFASA